MSEQEGNVSKAICTITFDLVQALALERESLKGHMEQLDRDMAAIRGHVGGALASGRRPTSNPSTPILSDRSETTYLHIVGTLLMLLLERSPSGQPHASFPTQESVVGALVERYGHLSGISDRTLLAKFAAAKRALARD